MKAILFHVYDECMASNGGEYSAEYCVEDKVHFLYSEYWYDQSGDEKNSFTGKSYTNFRPCDGSCKPAEPMELNPEVSTVVEKALSVGFASTKDVKNRKWSHPELRCPQS